MVRVILYVFQISYFRFWCRRDNDQNNVAMWSNNLKHSFCFVSHVNLFCLLLSICYGLDKCLHSRCKQGWAALHNRPLPPCLFPPRLEQPYINGNARFFQALSQCRALRRLCIVSRNGTFQADAVVSFMESCLDVIVCHMFMGGTLVACRNLQKTLQDRWAPKTAWVGGDVVY